MGRRSSTPEQAERIGGTIASRERDGLLAEIQRRRQILDRAEALMLIDAFDQAWDVLASADE